MNMNYCRATRINDQLNDRYVAENAYEDVVTYPKLITLTTTLRCNYRCWMCYQKEFKSEMDWRIVENIEPALPFVKTLQIFGGEPLAYSRFGDLCATAGKFCCELDVITNGSLLDEERRAMLLDNNAILVKTSLEAATQETYHSIRGGDLFTVLGNLRALSDEKARRGLTKPALQINFVAMERNIRELPALVPLAAEAGVERILVLFVNAQAREDLARESLFFHKELSDDCMEQAVLAGREHGVEVSVPGFFDGRATEEAALPDTTCHSPWKNCIITVEGKVTFCCGTGKVIGNVLETGIDDIWNCDRITRFRQLVNTDTQPGSCMTCRVKSRNIMM